MTCRLSAAVPLLALAITATACAAPGVSPTAGPAPAPPDVKPAAIENVGVDQKIDAALPLDLVFRNDEGGIVRLGDYFRDGKPVILSLNYSNCPGLCSVQLTGLTKSLARLDLTAGEDFQVVSVSIDPSERPAKAAETKKRYLAQYARGQADGWHFLTGDKRGIARLTDAVGFRYKYLPKFNEYSHAAAAILCTPDGRVSRYLIGVEYPEPTLRLALVEASAGKLGSLSDQFVLLCFHYDTATDRYVPDLARMVMSVAGGVTVMLLGGGLLVLWSRDRTATAADADPHDPSAAVDPARADVL